VCLCLLALDAQAQSDNRRFELGGQFVGFSVHADKFLLPGSNDVDDIVFGGGARLGYNITRHFAVEAEGTVFQRPPTDDPATRGRWAQAFFGVKAGKRSSNLGVFAKLRPGFSRFDGITSVMTGRNGAIEISPIKDNSFFAIDVGGGIELYPSRRWIVRLDASDVIIRYTDRPGKNFNIISNPVSESYYGHAFRFSVGVAVRF
jgi:opacity protein-like surface antigen